MNNNEMIKIIKLKNINGDTCYINSIINILYQTCYLQKFILTNVQHCKNNMFDNVKELFVAAWDNPGRTIAPHGFLYEIYNIDNRWNNGIQQDSHEFLISILDHLINNTSMSMSIDNQFLNKKVIDVNDITFNNILYNIYTHISINNINKNNNSYIFNLFNSYYQDIFVCKYCNTKTIIVDSNNILLLNIMKRKRINCNIYDLLKYHFGIEQICKNCEFCGFKNILHNRKKLIWKTSNILIIGFVRFLTIYNNGILISKKINDNINYPMELNISEYYNRASPYKNRYLYDLYAINLHIGNTNNIDSGHYISIIKTLNMDNWYLYDDEQIKKINNLDDLQDNNAYILFYKLK